jgi:hypothetical protein
MFIDLFLAILIPSCIGLIRYSLNMGSNWFKSGFVIGSDWFNSGSGSHWFRVSNSNHDLLVQSYSGYTNKHLSTVHSYSNAQYSLSTVSYRSRSSFDKTLVPTFDNTLAPTLDTTISFESTMSLSGISKPFLDDLAQTSVVIATAKSANVSTSFVFFIKGVKQDPSKNIHNKFLKSVSYDIDATTQLNVPTNGKSPQSLYDSLVSNLVNSVSNGDFNAFLMSASIALNSSSTQNAISNGVVLSPMSFDGPSFAPVGVPSIAPVGVPSSMPSFMQTNDNEKTAFIILVFLMLVAFLGSLYIKHKQQHINIEIESI